ncbi:MAG: hypothetical protein LBV34_01875 [Nocardiopsaceae bacterium]|jgi:hypothetical protein|nr:hypothetical protein [Nocardiopsaceae bacterium]
MNANPAGRQHEPGRYAIRVKGHLDSKWSAWFDGLAVARGGDGTTILHGQVADQAALHGVLRKIRDLGLPLISVTQDDSDHPRPPATDNQERSGPTKRRPA